jgi:hypothetical protein
LEYADDFIPAFMSCFVVTDSTKQKRAYVYFKEEPGRRSAAKLLTKDVRQRLMQYVARAFGAYGVHRFDQANQIAQARLAARACYHRAHCDHQPGRCFIEGGRTAEGVAGAQCLNHIHVQIGQLICSHD